MKSLDVLEKSQEHTTLTFLTVEASFVLDVPRSPDEKGTLTAKMTKECNVSIAELTNTRWGQLHSPAATRGILSEVMTRVEARNGGRQALPRTSHHYPAFVFLSAQCVD